MKTFLFVVDAYAEIFTLSCKKQCIDFIWEVVCYYVLSESLEWMRKFCSYS